MRATGGNGRDLAWLGATTILAAAVMLLPQWPALVDLPGHIAHYHIALENNRSALLERYYTWRWMPVPNLGGEIVAVALAPLIGLNAAVRVLVAVIPALTVAGMLALARATHGRVNPISLLALPLAFSYPFAFGFINSSLSTALALLGGALWIRLLHSADGRRGRMILALLASPVLMLAHIIGWGIFGLICAGSTLAVRWPEGGTKAIRETVVGCLPMVWPLVALVLTRQEVTSFTGDWFAWRTIVTWGMSVLRERWMALDVVSAALLYGVCGLPLLLRGRFAFAPALAVPAALAWLAVLLLPLTIFGSTYANVRILPSALALSVLAVAPRQRAPKWAWWTAGLFVGIRFTTTAAALLIADGAARRQIATLDHIAPGSRVLAFGLQPCERRWDPPRLRNIHALAPVRRDALVNGLFSEQGAHMLSIHYPAGQDWMKLGTNMVVPGNCYGLPTLDSALTRAPLGAFDYLWLTMIPEPMLPRRAELKLVWRTQDSVLYRVEKPAR